MFPSLFIMTSHGQQVSANNEKKEQNRRHITRGVFFIFFPRRNGHVLKGLLVAWRDCWLPADAGGFKKTCWVLLWCLPESLLQEMPLAIIRYILHFVQSLPTFFLQRACSLLLISVQRNMEEIGDKYERSGKCPDRTRLSDISPQKKLFQGYWRCLPSISLAHSFPPGPSRVLWMTVNGLWKK